MPEPRRFKSHTRRQNLNLEGLRLPCLGLDFTQMWLAQTVGVPLIYPVCACSHLIFKMLSDRKSVV